jgi:hypothetical protein
VFVFDHDGITTTVPQPGENWVEQSGVWVTNPHEHPEHIELLRDEGGALREEFGYFADCALRGNTPTIGRPEDAAAALEATLAAKESA